MSLRKFVCRITGAAHRRALGSLYAVRGRVESWANVSRVTGNRALIVCYGNIYRSPFAAEKLRLELAEADWEIRSAGLFDKKSGRCCTEEFISLTRNYGVDLKSHRSSIITTELLDWCDIVVIMDRHNRYQLRPWEKICRNKIVWLGAFLDGEKVEIEDPYGRSDSHTAAVVDKLDRAVSSLTGALRRVAS